jgi:Tol biopolymer transport system component
MMVKKGLNALGKMKRVILLGCFIMIMALFGYLLFARREATADDLAVNTVAHEDYLVYVIDGYSGYNKGQLMFYDPAEGIHAPILPDWDVERIAVSAADRLAFTAVKGEERGIYILDYPFMDGLPVRIAGPLSGRYFQLAWSQDGRYLAYVSAGDEGATLSMWDGTTIWHSYHSPESIGEMAWGPDGRLAFTDYCCNEADSDEVFIWAEGVTVSLSQNPSGDDRFPAWSGDGRLAFLSERERGHDIYIWDGVSTKNGLPDVDTFINVAPNLTGYYSSPTWTHSGLLTFEGAGLKDENIQIYEWDGFGVTDISQYPDSHSVGGHWRHDGYWAFMTSWLSSEHLIFVRDGKNRTRLTAEGHSPVWSPNGQLMFCTQQGFGFGWALTVWDGQSIVEIGRGYEIEAVWPGGERIGCSHG